MNALEFACPPGLDRSGRAGRRSRPAEAHVKDYTAAPRSHMTDQERAEIGARALKEFQRFVAARHLAEPGERVDARDPGHRPGDRPANVDRGDRPGDGDRGHRPYPPRGSNPEENHWPHPTSPSATLCGQYAAELLVDRRRTVNCERCIGAQRHIEATRTPAVPAWVGRRLPPDVRAWMESQGVRFEPWGRGKRQ